MIKIIKGTYGLKKGDRVEAMTPGSEPFSLSPSREAELVEQGVAEYVGEPAEEAPKPRENDEAEEKQEEEPAEEPEEDEPSTRVDKPGQKPEERKKKKK